MRVSFDGECTVARSGEIKQDLLRALESGEPLDLDFQAVTRIDLAFCQLIHALRQSCRELGRECALLPGLPAGPADSAALCGLPGLAGQDAGEGDQP